LALEKMVKKEDFEKQLIESLKQKEKPKSISNEKPVIKITKKSPIKNLENKKAIKKQSQKTTKKIIQEAPSLKLRTEFDIATDFGVKSYKKFDKIIKAIVLFGSSIKNTSTTGSDIDLIIIIDDVSIEWNQELIAWYRKELDRLLRINPYRKSLHINTIKLSTWWEDLMRGDPVVMNILRYGEAIIDMAGFYEPIKLLLLKGRIRPSPEAIYNCLQRAPTHIARSKIAELNSIEGLYWAMVDSAHAALIASGLTPPSPEHIPLELKQAFVDKGKLNMKYIVWYREILTLHKDISHGKIHDLKGVEIDEHQKRTEEFFETMTQLVKELVE